MSTIKVVNIQHPDSVDPNLVLQADGDTVFASGLTVSGTFDIANDLTVSGNTGLGTSSPSSKLHVVDTTTNLQLESTANSSSGKIDFIGKDSSSNSYRTLTIDTSSTGEVNIETDPDNGGYSTDKSIIFKQASIEQVRIADNGNVGIGTSSPGAKFEVKDNSGAPGGNLQKWTADLGTNTRSAWLIAPEADDINDPFIFYTNNSWNFRVDTVDALRIDQVGKVGIGTTIPSSKLQVEGAAGSNSTIHIKSTSVGQSSFDGSGSGLLLTAAAMNTISKFTPAIQFGSTDPQLTTTNPKIGAAINAIAIEAFAADTDGGMDLAFYTTPANPGTGQTTTERMRIDSNGNVGIGTSAPDALLNVSLASNSTDTYFHGGGVRGLRISDSTVSNDGDTTTFHKNSGTGQYRFSNSTATRFHLDYDGHLTLTPDYGNGNKVLSLDIERAWYFKQINTGAATRLGLYSTTNKSLEIGGDSNSAPTMTVFTDTSKAVQFHGSISKSSGSFKIPHPLPSKAATHDLVHSFVEAPDASNLYAGMVDLVDGTATVNIDTAHRMTEGTFEALNTVQSWSSSNETGYAPVKCSISGNLLTIECQDPASTDTVYYEVRGIRKDQHMIETEWTDENGRVITEPLKSTQGT